MSVQIGLCRYVSGVGGLIAQSCPTLWDPMDCSLSGSSVHGILQRRILRWVAIPFSRVSSWPRGWTQISCIAGRFFTIWATREAPHIGLIFFDYVVGHFFTNMDENSLWFYNLTYPRDDTWALFGQLCTSPCNNMFLKSCRKFEILVKESYFNVI